MLGLRQSSRVKSSASCSIAGTSTEDTAGGSRFVYPGSTRTPFRVLRVSSFFDGYGLGLFVAAQIGPVSLLIVRSVLRGNFAIGLAMAAAVALVDLGYAALGLAGAARVLERTEAVRLTFGVVGAAGLVAPVLRPPGIGIRA